MLINDKKSMKINDSFERFIAIINSSTIHISFQFVVVVAVEKLNIAIDNWSKRLNYDTI